MSVLFVLTLEIMGIFASRMEGNIVSFLGTARRSESERQQKVLSILFFVGDAKIIGNLFYDKIFSLHLQNLWETQK